MATTANVPQKILEAVSQLPPLPASVNKLINLTADVNADTRAITQIIASDEVISAKLLRLVNSSYYGLSHKVNSIQQAVMIIGFKGVKELALGFSMMDFLNQKMKNLSIKREQFWRHSLAVAIMARSLAKFFGAKNPDEAFTAGLLHDIGKIVFMAYFTGAYQEAINDLTFNRKPLYMLEKEKLGMDHVLIGQEICKFWKLPTHITRVIGEHHTTPATFVFTTEEDKIVRAVYIADNICKMIGVGDSGDPYILRSFFKTTKEHFPNPEVLYNIIQHIPGEMRTFEQLYNIPPLPSVSSQTEGKTASMIFKDNFADIWFGSMLASFGFEFVAPAKALDNPAKCNLILFDAQTSMAMRSLRDKFHSVNFIDVTPWFQQDSNKGAVLHVGQMLRWFSKLVGVNLPNSG